MAQILIDILTDRGYSTSHGTMVQHVPVSMDFTTGEPCAWGVCRASPSRSKAHASRQPCRCSRIWSAWPGCNLLLQQQQQQRLYPQQQKIVMRMKHEVLDRWMDGPSSMPLPDAHTWSRKVGTRLATCISVRADACPRVTPAADACPGVTPAAALRPSWLPRQAQRMWSFDSRRGDRSRVLPVQATGLIGGSTRGGPNSVSTREVQTEVSVTLQDSQL